MDCIVNQQITNITFCNLLYVRGVSMFLRYNRFTKECKLSQHKPLGYLEGPLLLVLQTLSNEIHFNAVCSRINKDSKDELIKIISHFSDYSKTVRCNAKYIFDKLYLNIS